MTSCSEERNQINERITATIKTTTTTAAVRVMLIRFSLCLEQHGIGHRQRKMSPNGMKTRPGQVRDDEGQKRYIDRSEFVVQLLMDDPT